MPRLNRNIFATMHDAVMAALSFLLAVYIRLGTEQIGMANDYLGIGAILLMLVCVCVFISMRLYRGLWRYASMQDMVAIVKAVSLSILIFAILMFSLNRLTGMPRSVFFINWMLLILMLGGPRFAYRAFKDHTFFWQMPLHEAQKIPVLLIGANFQSEQFIRDTAQDMRSPYEVVAIADDHPNRKGGMMHRVPIHSGTVLLPELVRKLERVSRRPQKIIVTDDRATGGMLKNLLEMADGLGIPLARLPKLNAFREGVDEVRELRPIAVEDLLGRPQQVLDRDAMRKLSEGKRVLVTGAGGTIGGELTRQIAGALPAELILFELCEFNLYQIERELRGSFPALKLAVILGDVRDVRHIETVFRQYAPQLVFHAAANKHVPMSEGNIEEAVLTNVFGTRAIAEACLHFHAETMVMISTDKAVNPSNVMGASKRLAEHFCQALAEANKKSKTKFITVRFGNVLGSTGSVVPLFQEQLAKGGPLTVTHPEMTRYFMTVREAVELVLQAAVLGAQMQGRQECIFVLDMGKPVRIMDLALQMIRLAGLRPHEDIKIATTGLRPGEKLYEELFHFAENAVKTSHESIFLAAPRFTDMAHLRKALDALYNACVERKTAEALALLRKLVPEFQPNELQKKAL